MCVFFIGSKHKFFLSPFWQNGVWLSSFGGDSAAVVVGVVFSGGVVVQEAAAAILPDDEHDRRRLALLQGDRQEDSGRAEGHQWHHGKINNLSKVSNLCHGRSQLQWSYYYHK